MAEGFIGQLNGIALTSARSKTTTTRSVKSESNLAASSANTRIHCSSARSLFVSPLKFSVLLNNYNYARYIGAAIDSVLAQTYKDFELIIVDDGSTDISREIINHYTDPRILTVFKQNGGQASAFKAGFAKTSGEYIAFLDADDVWDANKLERCVHLLGSNSEVVLLNHSFREIDANGDVIATSQRFLKDGTYDLLSDLRRLDIRFSLVPTSFLIGRRKECLQLDFDVDQWRIGADTPVIVGLGLRGAIYNLPEPLGSYRRHGDNLWLGRYDNHILYQYFKKFYQLANIEMQRLGQNESFNFSQSEFAMNYLVVESSKYSPRGICRRLRKLFILQKQANGRENGRR